MSTALIERPVDVVPVTADQLDLVRRTVAKDATADELKLYLYDCARQGVHPLDKLIHFTKRKGKYTPITSIDFMRTRAADTGEYAGSDDAVFSVCQHCGGKDIGPETDTFAAAVTVWRLVQGQRCPFTATARWSEYKPAENDFMWQKMPHTMLAKCAEALALRKGFPRQLAGLYAKEEMDQADEPKGYVVTAPQHGSRSTDGDVQAMIGVSVTERDDTVRPPTPNSPQLGPRESVRSSDGGAVTTQLRSQPRQTEAGSEPADSLRIERVERKPTKNKTVTRYIAVLSDGRKPSFIKDQLAAIADECCQNGEAVTVETEQTQFGENLTAIRRVKQTPELHIDAPGLEEGEEPPF